MAKVLVTGMTSPQSSKKLNAKSLSFAGAASQILEKSGHRVEWGAPNVNFLRKDYDKYDAFLVGIAPALSVTANRAYGVLSFIDAFREDERLKFFVDSPNISSIAANLRAIDKDKTRLFTTFYALRKEYEAVIINMKVKNAVLSAVEFLNSEEWPSTIIPVTPWSSAESFSSALSENAAKFVSTICVDSFFIEPSLRLFHGDRSRTWLLNTDKTKWIESTLHSLTLPHSSMKKKRSDDDESVFKRMQSSFGALISPEDNGSISWSHRWAQALNAGAPVASDWKITSSIGPAWSHLAAGIEEMSEIDRYELSVLQRQEYTSSIPSQDTVTDTLQRIIGV